ncbi:MAG: sensor histidine kinase [Thermoleophilia bacterium]
MAPGVKPLLDRFIARQDDPLQVRMAKSAAWLYTLGVAVVLAGIFLPADTDYDHTPVYLLVFGGLLASVFLVAFPWELISARVFYPLTALASADIATLVYFTGGVESPYQLLYFLIAIWAAYFFSFYGFAAVAAVAIVSLMSPYLYEQDYSADLITLGLMRVLFMVITGGLVNLLVTQIKQRNQELALSNERLALKVQEVLQEQEKSQAVIASVGDGVFVVDNQGRVTLWNHSAEKITGFAEAEIIGRERPAGPYGQESTTACVPFLVAVPPVEDETGGSFEVQTCRSDGAGIWLSVSAAPIWDASRRKAGSVYVFRDISGLKQLERTRSDFVATVSHELRTPLTSILGFSKTLLRPDAEFPEESRRAFLQEIVREGERLGRMIEDVLSVSRIESGILRLDLKPVNAGASVRHVIDNVARLTDQHRFIINAPDDLAQVRADPDKLYQVLLNLVVNAVKYSPDGGTITVALEPVDGSMVFTVADEGVGISKESLPHVFERFYRAAVERVSVTGTGLGLFVSRRLVEEMGGEIWADSTPGEGSSFHFRLPEARPEP